MKKKTYAIIILLLFDMCSSAQMFTYTNPLPFQYEALGAIRREIRDPCIIREQDTYYLVFTVWPFANRQENRLHLPNQGGSLGIKLYSSKDLKNWIVKTSKIYFKGFHNLIKMVNIQSFVQPFPTLSNNICKKSKVHSS